MAIRFRCAYCNQLLGIARRKAGSVVRCPTCAGQVVVPSTEPEGTAVPQGPEQQVFERSDFDQVFRMPAVVPQAAASPMPAMAPAPGGAWAAPAEPAYDVERIDPREIAPLPGQGPQPRTIALSSVKATVLLVTAILAVAIAFGAGFLVGRFL